MHRKNRRIGYAIFIFCGFLSFLAGLFCAFIPSSIPPKRIGVLIYQGTPTTTSFVQGIKSSLMEQGYYQGKNLLLFVENQGESGKTVSKFSAEFSRKKIDLLITTGKNLTAAAARYMPNKPIIFALISDPIRDETIQTLIDNSKNILGVSYFTPYDRTLQLSKKIIPGLRSVALILPHPFSWADKDKLLTAADDTGLKIVTVETPMKMLYKSILRLKGKVDAVYLPNEIQLIMARAGIRKALIEARLPAISNNLGFQYGAVITYYADPETMGEIAGKMAVKIFHGANTEFMPVELSSYFKLVINLQRIKELNYPINEDVLSYANEIIQ